MAKEAESGALRFYSGFFFAVGTLLPAASLSVTEEEKTDECLLVS